MREASFCPNRNFIMIAMKQSHQNIQCLRRRTCKICLAKHAADLHGCKKDDSKSDDDTEKAVKNNCVNTKDLQCESVGPAEVLSMCVVPAKILHNNSEKEMITFA